MRILVDLDNVLVDFDRSACRVHKITYEQLQATRTPGEWSLLNPFGKISKRLFTIEQFWKPIQEEGSYFWATIPPTQHINELINLVQHYAKDNWRIVTSPSRDASSYLGKAAWAKSWFGADFDKLHITRHKYDFAKKDVVLIDDNQRNIAEFVEAGGPGIIFPHIGNCMHNMAHDPLSHVANRLKELSDAL